MRSDICRCIKENVVGAVPCACPCPEIQDHKVGNHKELPLQRFCKSILYLVSIISIYGCQQKNIKITPAFYHWQTNLDLSPKEITYLSAFSVNTIYPKFFDVDWDFNQAAPTALATLVIKQKLPSHFNIVPSVFITNRTLTHLSVDQLSDLAQKISEKLIDQIKTLGNPIIQEIQFDCDWTLSTKEKYFQLLELIKKEFPKEISLSATIRLHQIKFVNKTGVPPVKRGMLMYYNMGEVQQPTTQNSILDNKIGQKYISQLATYPLPLDVALPLFKWGVLFRNDKMIKLLNQLSERELVDAQRFTKIAGNHWQVAKSTYLNGVYLYEGDEIRLEKSEMTDLKLAAELLNKHLKREDRRVAFYHLDQSVIEQFEVEELHELLDHFE